VDFDDIYVGLAGRRPFGVFEAIEDALPVMARLGECEVDDITVERCFNGDVLLLVRNYTEGRLIKTRLY
jgi:hypothetical protein